MNENYNFKIWTVDDFLEHLNDFLSKERVVVEGEIFDFKKHPTGFYFYLKDPIKKSILPCYLHPKKAIFLGFDLKEGDLIQVRGFSMVYKPKGTLNFYVESLLLKGEGALKKAYEILKSKLEKEGLFNRKRPIPQFIQNIGLITSKNGAAIDDFRKNLRKINLKIYFYDVRVEGIQAPEQIIKAIDYFNQKLANKIDVLVIIRGGGSLEDLQAFNNEEVVRKIFSSKIPVITGIGHERDIPLSNLVSDLSVSTPSFAAQVINDSWLPLFQELPLFEKSIFSLFEKIFLTLPILKNKLFSYFEQNLKIQKIFLNNFQSLTISKLRNFINEIEKETLVFEKYLKNFNPLNNLKLGYSLTFDKSGKLIKNVEKLKKGDKIKTMFHKGSVQSKVEEIKKYEK